MVYFLVDGHIFSNYGTFFARSKKREGEGAGGANHHKVTAANGGRVQTF